MTNTTAADIRTLLERALLNKNLKCFGIDGLGSYGKSDLAQVYPISHITLGWLDLSNDKIGVHIHLEHYNSLRFGHIMTDKNFAFSFNQLLIDNHINTSCWEWSPVAAQQTCAVTLTVTPSKLDL